MKKAQISPRDVYELVENDKGEVMILLYAKDPVPNKSTFTFDALSGVLKIYRTKDDVVFVAGLQLDAVNKLAALDKLYVCEVKYTENEEENEIVNAYIASLQAQEKVKSPKVASKAEPKGNVAEKAKQARERTLKKAQKK